MSLPRACLLSKVNIETEQIVGKITCPNKVNTKGKNNIGAPKKIFLVVSNCIFSQYCLNFGSFLAFKKVGRAKTMWGAIQKRSNELICTKKYVKRLRATTFAITKLGG